jgi:hypothetical protein
LFELSNFGVNFGENLIYRHELKYTEAISYRTRSTSHT